MSDNTTNTEKYVGYNSLNSLVGRIKKENDLQNAVINTKVTQGSSFTGLEIDAIWNEIIGA